MKDDFPELGFFIIVIIIIIFVLKSMHSAPILDNKLDPFIIKKIKACEVYENKARYFGKIQKSGMFSPKPIILDKNAFNVGDTIYIGK